MAEIPQVLVQRRLRRGTGAGRTPALPGTPTRGLETAGAGARSLAGLAGQVGQATQQINRVAQQFDRARGAVEQAQISANVSRQFEDERNRILLDQNINPLDRARMFSEFSQNTINQQADDVPALFRGQFIESMTNQSLAIERRLADQGRQDFVAQGTQTLENRAQEFRDQMAITTGFDHIQARTGLMAEVGEFVTAGIITEADGNALIRETVRQSESLRVRRNIEADADGMLRYLEDLVVGGPVQEAFGDPADEDLPGLLQLAETRLRSELTLDATRQRQLDRDNRVQEDTFLIEVDTQVRDPDISRAQLRELHSQVAEQCAANIFSPERCQARMDDIQKRMANQANPFFGDDPEVLTALREGIYGADLSVTKEQVIGFCGTSLTLGTCDRLSRDIERRVQAQQVTRSDAYQQGILYIRSHFGPVSTGLSALSEFEGNGDVGINFFDSNAARRENNQKQALALIDYFEAATAAAGQDGQNLSAFQNTWFEIADAIVQRYKNSQRPAGIDTQWDNEAQAVEAWRQDPSLRNKVMIDLYKHQLNRQELVNQQRRNQQSAVPPPPESTRRR